MVKRERLKRETRNSVTVVVGRFEFVTLADAGTTSTPPRAPSLWRGDTRPRRLSAFGTRAAVLTSHV